MPKLSTAVPAVLLFAGVIYCLALFAVTTADALFSLHLSSKATVIASLAAMLSLTPVIFGVALVQAKRQEWLKQNGILATANIQRVQGNYGHTEAIRKVVLFLEVHPSTGAPYSAHLSCVVNMWERRYSPGDTIQVRYDPQKPERVILVEPAH